MDDFGDVAACRHTVLREDGEARTEKLPVAVDLDGEAQSGRATRRRRRGDAGAAGERRGRGGK